MMVWDRLFDGKAQAIPPCFSGISRQIWCQGEDKTQGLSP